MSTAAQRYLQICRRVCDIVGAQEPQIAQVADRFTSTILAGRMVHVFGAGHSRIMVEEMWPRYGSFPGFNPIVELSLTYHNPVVGANGQRQAMFLETQSGLAERILRNFDIDARDCGLIISSSGCNTVPIEMAEQFRDRGVHVTAIVSLAHSRSSTSNHPLGHKLADVADQVLDTGAPPGDAAVQVDRLPTPVAPVSTIGGCLLVNAVKAEVAERLSRAGSPPTVLTAACLVGQERSRELFEAAYDEHARRLARLYAHLGESPGIPKGNRTP